MVRTHGPAPPERRPAKTYEEISHIVNLTTTHVRHLEASALRKIAEAIRVQIVERDITLDEWLAETDTEERDE